MYLLTAWHTKNMHDFFVHDWNEHNRVHLTFTVGEQGHDQSLSWLLMNMQSSEDEAFVSSHRGDVVAGCHDLPGKPGFASVEGIATEQDGIQDDATRPDIGPLAVILRVCQDDFWCLHEAVNASWCSQWLVTSLLLERKRIRACILLEGAEPDLIDSSKV